MNDVPVSAWDPDTPIPDFIREFVEHWGVMARAWGINPTMGELFALLYITDADWSAADLCTRLGVSRGNVSMNLRELINWGVVHKVHHQGKRVEYFRAETDVWVLFRRILVERKRRELDPTCRILESAASRIEPSEEHSALRARILALSAFFRRIDRLASRLTQLDPADFDHLIALFDDEEPEVT